MSMTTESTDDNVYSGQLLTASSEVMVSAVIFFMVVLVFVFFLYLYAKHYWVPERERGSLFVFAAAAAVAAADSPGLDPTILESLPITIFQSTNFKEFECSVCLSEVTDGEEVRLLPKCKHGFHLECIDMWFHSHSTCPLCRTSPDHAAADPAEEEDQQEQLAANCLAGPSTSTKPRDQLVIEIPIRPAAVMMDLAFPSPSSPLPTSKFPGDHTTDQMKTPTSATSWQQLRSLRRLLSSRGKRAMTSNSSCCSTPMESAPLDIEQGIIIPAINPLTPKTTPSN